MATVGRGAEQYTVRMPDGLRDRIKAAADVNNRSMNAEIVSALETAYPAPEDPAHIRQLILMLSRFEVTSDADRKFLDRITKRIGQVLIGYRMNTKENAELLAEIRAYVDARDAE